MYEHIISHRMQATPLGYIVVTAVDNADRRLGLSDRETGANDRRRIRIVAEEFRKGCIPLFNKLCPVIFRELGYVNITAVAASDYIARELGLGNAGEVAFPTLVGLMGQMLMNHCLNVYTKNSKNRCWEARADDPADSAASMTQDESMHSIKQSPRIHDTDPGLRPLFLASLSSQGLPGGDSE